MDLEYKHFREDNLEEQNAFLLTSLLADEVEITTLRKEIEELKKFLPNDTKEETI